MSLSLEGSPLKNTQDKRKQRATLYNYGDVERKVLLNGYGDASGGYR